MIALAPSPGLLLRLRRNGIVHPYWAWRQAKVEGLGLPLAGAMLIVESGGGQMIYGHDEDKWGRCPGWGWGAVTRANYAAFKHLRQSSGRSNGVGGCQLTSAGLQDEADAIGGCWRIRCNYAVGFRYLAQHIRDYGLREGIARYNGSGPLAEAYADRVLAIAGHLKAAGCGAEIGLA